jgi:hypothetical protein
MRIEEPKVYPLEAFLNWIPQDGVQLTRGSLEHISNYFHMGGIICEQFGEVVEVLQLLEEWTNVIKLDEYHSGGLILRKNI